MQGLRSVVMRKWNVSNYRRVGEQLVELFTPTEVFCVVTTQQKVNTVLSIPIEEC